MSKDSKIDLFAVANMRGYYEILRTDSFLINDNEFVRWRFIACGKLLKLKFIFRPTDSIKKHPPIEVSSEENTDEIMLRFVGWNHRNTYRIDSPLEIAQIGSDRILLGIVNIPMGTSNFCTMQVYRDNPRYRNNSPLDN